MSSNPRKGPRGLRDVATPQTLLNASQPRERHQLAGRFARLESERARLERELAMWNTRRKVTEDKLAKIYGQIDALRPLLLEGPAKVPAARQSQGHSRPRAATQASGPTPQPGRTISLNY